jgi:hypothetical protein
MPLGAEWWWSVKGTLLCFALVGQREAESLCNCADGEMI